MSNSGFLYNDMGISKQDAFGMIYYIKSNHVKLEPSSAPSLYLPEDFYQIKYSYKRTGAKLDPFETGSTIFRDEYLFILKRDKKSISVKFYDNAHGTAYQNVRDFIETLITETSLEFDSYEKYCDEFDSSISKRQFNKIKRQIDKVHSFFNKVELGVLYNLVIN